MTKKTKKRGSYLWGWAGELNTGDDVFLAVVTNYLRMSTHNAEFFIDGDRSKCTSALYGVKVAQSKGFQIPGQTRLKRFLFRRRSHYFLMIGGSLLPTQTVVDSIARDNFWTKKGREMVALGLSVGPFESQDHEKSTAELLSRMSYVAFRDDNSYKWALAQGLTNTILAFDLAVLFPNFLLENKDKPKLKRIGISLLPWRSQKGKCSIEDDLDFSRQFGILLRSIASEQNFEVVFFSLCVNPKSDDRLMASAFGEGYGRVGITNFEHNGDPGRTYEKIAETSHFISMRLHGAILAFTAGVPFLQLEYHQKCADFAETIGLDARQRFSFDESDTQSLESKLREFLSVTENSTNLSLTALQKRALKNFHFLIS